MSVTQELTKAPGGATIDIDADVELLTEQIRALKELGASRRYRILTGNQTRGLEGG